MYVKSMRSHCPHCGEVAPQKVVREQGEKPLLWCDVCRHVTIAEHDLSLEIDPLPFSPALSVQVAELDDDHERLIEILNELHGAAKRGDRAALDGAARRMFHDLDRHFAREEALLQSWDFPLLDEHRAQHAALSREIGQLVERLPAAPPGGIAEIALAIKFCLVEHLGEDMKYKDHLAEAMAAGRA